MIRGSNMFLSESKLKDWRVRMAIDVMSNLEPGDAPGVFATACCGRFRQQFEEGKKWEGVVRRSMAEPCVCKLHGWNGPVARDHSECSLPPGWDHPLMWNANGRHALITYATYQLDVMALADYCRDNGLFVDLLPISFYYPGGTHHVVIGTPEGWKEANREPYAETRACNDPDDCDGETTGVCSGCQNCEDEDA